MRSGTRCAIFGWGLAAIGLLLGAGWAQIPTVEERLRDSGRNPENCTWRAQNIRIWPVPKREKDDPPLVACYRYDFTLPAKARQAAMTFFPVPAYRYWVFVNGQLAADAFPPARIIRGIRNLDLTRFLRAGRNVLALKGETRSPMGFYLAVEGIVFGQDGSTMRLITDQTWKGGWDLAPGWDDPKTDPSDLPSVSAVPPDRPVAWSPNGEFNPPYYGPIQITSMGMSQPIFDEEKPVDLNITLLNMGAGKPPSSLTYEIMDEFSRKNIGQGTVALSPKGKLDLVGRVNYRPLPAGAYRFRFILTANSQEVDRRDYEVASVGVIKQRLVEGTHYEEGMDLKEVWSVDCTAEPEPGKFIACDWKGRDAKTVVREGPAGRYRALAENRNYLSLAYRFKVKRLFVPHLVVIEWPDDAPRSFLSHVVEANTMFPKGYYYYQIGGFQRGDAGWVSVDDHPVRTNQMRKLRFIYWPNEEEAAIHIWNLALTGGAPAAASRITVYEITNDLPALRIADAGDRMIGYHTERGPYTMAATYYAGPIGAFFSYKLAGIDHPEFYRNWYTTTENFIKCMRFSGQNMYLMGHFMYRSVLYPSKRYIFSQNSYPDGDANRDYIGLILRMFERNGMSLISSVEYVNTPDLAAEYPATDEEIRAGAPTLQVVSRTGKTGGTWGGVNHFHPRVQESVLTIVDELIELYKDYPAWKGINFILSRQVGGPLSPGGWGPNDDPLDWGYGDYTISLFQKETRIKIPVSPKDPERFAKRYEWLMAHAKQKWVDWRCSQYTRIYRNIRDRLVRARPDLKLYLTSGEPLVTFMSRPTKQALDLDGHYDDLSVIRQVVKSFGLDPEALKKERGIVLSYLYSSPGTLQTYAAKHRAFHATAHSQTWNNFLANDGKGGAYIFSSIYHSGYDFPKGKWLFQRSVTRQGYLWPRYMNDTFVNILVRSNPTWMPHTWMDVCESLGRLHELRLFARAYRSLPNGKYQRLTGNGLDQNIWVERTRAKGAEYAYAANTNWWDLEVTLQFAPGAKVHDLIKDQQVPLKEGKWSFHLGPYGVQTFRITGTRGSAIKSAMAKLPKEAASATEEAVEQARKVVARARAKEAEIRDLPGWKRVEELEQMIARIEELRTAGDISRAYETATSWRIEHAQQQVINEALDAMPFLVLGPFGDPKDTVGGGNNKGNVEVVPECRGMETPYLGESDQPDLSRLVANFGPDLSRSYQAYLNKEARWQEAIKAYHLSFYGKCHSESPLWMVAYAYTEIYSPEERDAAIWVGSDHAIWVWVNGRVVLRHGGHGKPRGGQRPSAPDQNRGNCYLQKGWNRVLVKAVQRGMARVFFRVTDREGNPLDDLRFRVPKSG